MTYKDNVNSELILTIGGMSGVLVLVAVIGLQAWFMSEEQRELDEKSTSNVNQPLADLRAAQRKNLADYRWVSKDKTIAAIPIEQAKSLLIESNGKLPASGTN
jgi:hypothetical protein